MKKRNCVIGISVVLFLMCSEWASAQAITIGGEIRTRAEVRSGAKTPLYDSLGTSLVTVMRTRLNASYTTNVLKTKVVLQDTRVYGSTAPGTLSSALGVYEAWGEYLMAPGISFALGRQAIEYDDKRLFSASNWSNTGNAHDLLLFKYTSTDLTVHVAGAWNNATDVYQESAYTNAYKTMTYIWASKPLGNLNLSAIWVNEGYQKTTATNLQGNINYDRRWYRNTVGGNLGYNTASVPVTFYGTGYYQFGHNTAGKKLDAYLLAVKATGKVVKPLTVNAGIDLFSGSKYDLATDQDHTFNKLFGSNHSFNGAMEYWSSLPTGGLTDLYGGAEYAIGAKFKAEAAYHAFSLAQTIKGNDTKGLGSEFDLTFTYTLSPQVAFQGGWSCYSMTSLADNVKKLKTNVDTKFPQWAFVMITLKPTFLSVK